MSPLPRRALRSLAAAVAIFATTAATVAVLSAPAQAGNRVTPGNFTGYGFDQCLAPTQEKMDAWREYSPFSAVGIYISGKSRACRSQPNLTKTWVATQLARQWRLLPITLGPQASCQPRFPRYKDDVKINPDPADDYLKARRQGWAEARYAVDAAQALGITAGSTLWYDLEGFDLANTRCRESALRFLHSWTRRLHALDYVSGVYSSAGSGIKMLDNARINRPGQFVLPDMIWIARWDGAANTSTTYISDKGWNPGRRVKQYQGGHDETWGGVTINIDRNFLNVGTGSQRRAAETFCGSVSIDLASYPRLREGSTQTTAVKVLQCLLTRQRVYDGKINGVFSPAVTTAVRAFQQKVGAPKSNTWRKRDWIQMLSRGPYRPAKYGTTGRFVARLQRALVAATGTRQAADGAYFRSTENLVKAWQKQVGMAPTGVMHSRAWRKLQAGGF
jgi:hypothetical protein